MKYVILIIFVCFTSNAQATKKLIDPCKIQDTTAQMNECGKFELNKKDKELNIAFQKLIKSLVQSDQFDDTNYLETKKLLIEAQQSWIKYRDLDCKAKLRLNESGTMRGIIYLGCLAERTEQRTKELLNWNP